LDIGEDKDSSPPKVGGASLQRETVISLPWFEDFSHLIGLNKTAKANHGFAKQSVLNRKQNGSAKKDLFYYLLDEAGLLSKPLSLPTLINEATLAIIAGSDTTGTTLSNIFYFLLSNPEIYAKLQSEVEKEFPKGSDILADSSGKILRNMKYLNAVINETLRLRPAVPNGVQRTLPRGSGAVHLGRCFIPEGTTVQVAPYSVHQNPKYFSPEPEKWKPERWISEDPGQVLDHSAFFPFSYGPTNCVGKNLASYELRTVTCSLIQRFEFEFAAGYNTAQWDAELEDHSIYVKGSLPVRIKPRW